ncbi:MAG TPA: hypothetical protein VG938_03640 [Verrucomicrobiae bacterium]|jgi:hypothetical protein|nr:hypothetical protein [Verrucomicrobiae bacterium]
MKTVDRRRFQVLAQVLLLLCGVFCWHRNACGQTDSPGDIMVVGPNSYTQSDGILIAGTVGIYSVPEYLKGGGGLLQEATFTITGGILECSSMEVQGDYYQTGGTNCVSGNLVLDGQFAFFHSTGFLCASNLDSEAAFPQNVGGTVVITNELRLDEYDSWGPYIGSGDLTVSNITLTSGTSFSFAGNSLNQSGILSIEDAQLSFSGLGAYHLGSLQLNSGTNSVIIFSPGQCRLHLAESSGMAWTNGAVLNIQNWSGSLYGGGPQQIIFGSNASALTPQQLSQIQFQNPAGLASGNYSARILATGEIVPDTGAPLPLRINLLDFNNGAMHLSVGGDIGRSYAIEVSTDLWHWNTWTDQLNAVGTMSFDDYNVTNSPQRFYRARLMP